MPQFVEALVALTMHALEKKTAETVSTSQGILKENEEIEFYIVCYYLV